MMLRRPTTFYIALIAVTTPFFTIFLMIHRPDLSEEVLLVQKLAELQERLRHAEMMNQQRWQDMVVLTNDSAGSGTVLDLQLPSVYHFLPHIAGDPEAFRPALKISRGRTAASIVLGVPTVKREVQSYLMATLHNLIENMTPQERNSCLIVVFIAEVDKEFVTKQATEIQEEFADYVESGLVEVISPPASYYPDMDKLQLTLGDPPERVRWRTKQTLDFAYLMMYAQGKGTFYVQLEDDILSKPGYIRKMTEYAYRQVSLKKDWLILDFCQLGFIGKMFKCVDLSKFIVFFLVFYNDKPVDWLLDHMVQTKVCRFDKDIKDCKKRKDLVWIHYKPSLFQHVGTHSSLKGKVQKLKDHQFGKLSLFVVHRNPPAEVSTTLKVYKTYTIARAYRGDNFFWSILPQRGDNVTFRFTPPIRIERFLFRSGNPEHPEDRFYNTTVEVQLDYDPVPLPLPRTADGFYVVAGFKDTTGVASAELPLEAGPVRILRLNVQADAIRWAILSEVLIKERKTNQTVTSLSSNFTLR